MPSPTVLRDIIRAQSLHPDSRDYRDRIFAAGSSIDGADIAAIDRLLVRPAINQGIRQSILRKNVFLGNNLLEATVSLWYPSSESDKITLVNVVAGNYTRLGGLLFNGTSSYANCTTVLSTYLDATKGHFSFYCLTNNAISGSIIDFGATTGTPTMALLNGFNVRVFDSYNTSGSRLTTTAQESRTDGYILGSRVANNDSRRYRQGVQTGINTTVNATLPPALALFFGANNNNGIPNFYSNRAYCDFEIGYGLTPTQVSTWYECNQNFQRYMGRAIEL